MSYRPYEPIDPREAFTVMVKPVPADVKGKAATETESVAASQAAFLLAIRAGVLGCPPEKETLREFPLPDLHGFKAPHRINLDTACRYLGVSPGELRQEESPALQQEVSRLIREAYRKPSFKAAAALFEAALTSPHPLVAAAGAAGARETTRLRPKIRTTLEAAAKSRSNMVSQLALTAMSNIGPMESIVDKKVVKRPTSRKRHRESNTAVLTHGTFAANAGWYKPGGDFYEALKTRRPDVDLHDRSFRWTGAYTDDARQADADLLTRWMPDQGLTVPDFFAHSHGGTVAHLATHKGVSYDRLVLMGWPARRKWFPDFSKVNRIIDVRVRMDLVVLLDGGDQRFRSTEFDVEEHRNGWFDHGSTHDPDYWDDHGLWGVV